LSDKINNGKLSHVEDFYTVVCRPALPKDTQEVMDLTRLIWEGEDYIPHVWEEWLSDYSGMLAVAEYGGRVVGLGKLSLLAPGQWWLEGLRVHPEFQGRGIGSHLHDYLIKHWLKEGDGVIRLTTNVNRLTVHHMSEQTGFRRISEISPFKARAMDESSDAFMLLDSSEVQKAVTIALGSESVQASTDLMDLGWKWATINANNLGEAVARKHAWWWHAGQGLLAIWEEDWEQETGAVLMFLSCKLEKMVELLVDFRRLAGAMKHNQAGWFVPLRNELIPYLELAGYKRDWEESLYIFERQHP
jgi:GNAT superfamily N-acetyltransferase